MGTILMATSSTLIRSAGITLVRFAVYAGAYNCNFLRLGICQQAPQIIGTLSLDPAFQEP
jgi:hypothetical protein